MQSIEIILPHLGDKTGRVIRNQDLEACSLIVVASLSPVPTLPLGVDVEVKG